MHPTKICRACKGKIYRYYWYNKRWVPRSLCPLDIDQQINSAKSQQVKGEAKVQSITPIHVMLTPQAWELTDPNDGTHYLTQIFQQTNTHNPNVYSQSRLYPLDYPPQRSLGGHQLINQQNGTIWNEVYPPSNNTLTPFQPQNHSPSLTPLQNQLGPSDIVVQHLQQQTLNQTLLNDRLHSILSSQQNIQWETVSMMKERHENEQCIRNIQNFDGKTLTLMNGLHRLKR